MHDDKDVIELHGPEQAEDAVGPGMPMMDFGSFMGGMPKSTTTRQIKLPVRPGNTTAPTIHMEMVSEGPETTIRAWVEGKPSDLDEYDTVIDLLKEF